MTATAATLLDLLDRPAAVAASSPPPKSSWLRNHLIVAGLLTESGISRSARLRTCRACKRLVLAGLDDDVAAFEAWADPVPLSPLGEAMALIDGRRTYSLGRAGGRWLLDRRDSWVIAAGPKPRRDVLAEHRCHSPVPNEHACATAFAEITPPVPADAQPPF